MKTSKFHFKWKSILCYLSLLKHKFQIDYNNHTDKKEQLFKLLLNPLINEKYSKILEQFKWELTFCRFICITLSTNHWYCYVKGFQNICMQCCIFSKLISVYHRLNMHTNLETLRAVCGQCLVFRMKNAQ